MKKGILRLWSAVRTGALAAVCCATVAGCGGGVAYRLCEGVAWNTTFHITYRADRDLCDSVHAVMRAVELSLSPFCDSSIISRINRDEPVAADSMLRRVFAESQRVNRLSHGAFDPTIAPLINLWGFGTTGHDTARPSDSAIDSVLTLVGIDRCRMQPDGRITKLAAGTQFNFSALTKGYGCDLVGQMLRRNGCSDYMIEIGGEITAAGVSPRGGMWRVMIDAPVESADSVVHERMEVIELTDCGVATSGNYRNYRDIGGRRVGHISIDPMTGHPRSTAMLSVTIVAPECITADALATAAMAMPSDSAVAMLAAMPQVSALIVEADSVDASRCIVRRIGHLFDKN